MAFHAKPLIAVCKGEAGGRRAGVGSANGYRAVIFDVALTISPVSLTEALFWNTTGISASCMTCGANAAGIPKVPPKGRLRTTVVLKSQGRVPLLDQENAMRA